MDEQRASTLSDERLARDVERALQVDPGPAFLATVRARIAEESPAAHAGVFPLVGAARYGAAAVAIVATIAWVGWRTDRREPPIATVSTAANVAATPQVPVMPPQVVPARPTADTMRATSRAERRSRPAPPDFDVLISKEEAAALERLIAAATRQPLSIVVAATASPAPASTISDTDEIVIPPIVISPLELHASIEGARQ